MTAPAIAAMVSRLAAVRRAEVYADHASGQHSDPDTSAVLDDAELCMLPTVTCWCVLSEIERLGRQCCDDPCLAPVNDLIDGGPDACFGCGSRTYYTGPYPLVVTARKRAALPRGRCI